MQRQVPIEALPVLDVEHQYKNALHAFPELSREHAHALVEHARCGAPVRNEVVLSLQQRVYTMARRYSRRYQHVELMDLLQEANAAMIEEYETALAKDNPFAYLLRVASNTMHHCVHGQYDAIKTYHYNPRVPVASLDRPVAEGVSFADLLPSEMHMEEPDTHMVESLHSAVETLPQLQQMVIRRRYGLGAAQESLNAISRSLAPHIPNPSHAYYHRKRALTALRQRLTPLFPQYAGTGGAQ